MEDTKRGLTVLDLNSNHEASWSRVEELQAGRKEENIPLNDEYWKALKKHRAAHQAGTLK